MNDEVWRTVVLRFGNFNTFVFLYLAWQKNVNNLSFSVLCHAFEMQFSSKYYELPKKW